VAGCRVYCFAIVAALLGLTAVGTASAQDTLLGNMMRAQKDWLWFNIVDGRMSLSLTQLTNIQSTSRSPAGKETFKLRNENGQPRLSYELTGGEELLKVEVAGGGDDVHISRTPQGKSALLAVDFRQVPNEPMVLRLGTGAGQQVFGAADLWRLLIERPKECRQHLLPLLDMLRPGSKLAGTATEIEAKLLEGAAGPAVAERGRWAALVRQLGDDSFSNREAADRELRAGGDGATAYLRHLDQSRLDAEQRFRIRRILEAAAAQNGDDSPEQAAASLAGDPAVWLALLGRPELAARRAAVGQLAALLGEPIDVDPAAEPDSQKDKREQLRQRIEGK
jgi:hypothetical protein